jgi:putative MATE family efflux protein
MKKTAIFRDFTKYVCLNVLGMVCFSLYVLADTFFIAQALGANGLTGLNLSLSVYSVLQGFALMIGIGGATQYTILKSKNENANTIFTYSLLIGLFVAIIFVIIGMLLTTSLAIIFGADEVTLPLTKTYMQTILYFSPVFILNTILIVFIRNDNNPKLAMAGMVTGSFSNIVLDYIFLFPLSMGMFGAALATGLSLVLSLIVLSFHFLLESNRLNICKCKIYIKKIINIFLLGFSSLIGELSFGISLITFNLVILRIEGNIGVAAYGIVANIAIIIISLFIGVAQGIQPLISKGYGSNDNILVKQTIKYAITLVFLLAIIMYGLTYYYSSVIVALFNSEANISLALLARTGIKIYFIGLIFAGINIVIASFFSALDNPKKGIIISLLRSCVIIIPLVILLSAIFKMNGIWFSFVLTEFIVCVLSIVFLYV